MADPAESWETWLARYGPAALLYARGLTRLLPEAEDAVHDGFVRYWRHRERAANGAALFFACSASAFS